VNPQPVDLSLYLAEPSRPELYLRSPWGPPPDAVIFDIGACEGEDSIRYGRLFPGARIFSFEPLPANQAIIRANFARYGARAELVPVALSDRSAPATFHVSAGRPDELFSGEQWNYGNKSSSLLEPAQPGKMYGWIEFKEAITVNCQTLDGFCAARGLRQIDFIHLDVQGAEGLVLAGAAAMLPKTGAVWLEVANQELYRGQLLRGGIEQTMRAHGFIRALQDDRGAEGDQLYLNRRRWRNLAWFAHRGFRSLLGRAARLFRRTRPSPS
jgi:FkbM family methyltransferase